VVSGFLNIYPFDEAFREAARAQQNCALAAYPTNQVGVESVYRNYEGFLHSLLGFERLGMSSAKYH
jgi:hypothetical protein